VVAAPKAEGEEGGDEDEETLVTRDAFAAYRSQHVKEGKEHPDKLIESSSLQSVQLPPLTFKHSFPAKMLEDCVISRAQLETVLYACQAHEGPSLTLDGAPCRPGFFLGDGAGVGKGRQLSALIYQNWIQGRKKAIWLSASADLSLDARRDLDDVGGEGKTAIPSHQLKGKYDKLHETNGVYFATYSSLCCSTKNLKFRNPTTGAMENMSRMQQLIDWVGGADFDGCLLFDECHKAKNLVPSGNGKPTKMGICVEQLQIRLPKARVVYCSATGVSEPSHMGYMTRLGLWGPGTPFPAGFSSNKRQGNVDRTPFLESVNKGGVGMMELVAMHLRKQGRYISRTLSYEGCSFVIDDNAVPFSAVQLYDECASLFQRIYSELTDSLAGTPEDVAEFSARFPEKAKPKKRGRAAAESESENDR
jgi:hypothetical protein